MMRISSLFVLPLFLLAAGCCNCTDSANTDGSRADEQPSGGSAPPDGCPMFGGTPARNMVNLVDKNVPTDWSLEENKFKNVKWVADIGTRTYSGPIIAGGKVYIGTNNSNPRDKAVKEVNRAVLMCFDEADGKFLWQIAHAIPAEETFAMVQQEGLVSTPQIDAGKLYYTLSHGVVVCADAGTGKVEWEYDMRKELKVHPYHCTACSPLVVGDLIFVLTGNGIDGGGEMRKIPQPKAPSFIAVNKKTHKLVWQSNLPGDQIFEGQWSNPAHGVIDGKPQVIFAGGDAGVYSFEPETGKLIWEFHCYPRHDAMAPDMAYFVSTPVIYDNKVYIGLGINPDHEPLKTKGTYFLCIDATKKGDVSPGKSLEPKLADGKNSALVWSYGGKLKEKSKEGRPVVFDKTISTCSIHDGLVYIAELGGYVHCLDARTGEKYWVYDSLSSYWGSTYYVDGKIYIGAESGDMHILQAGKQLKVVAKVEVGEGMHTTPIVHGGVLFIPTMSRLCAIAEKK